MSSTLWWWCKWTPTRKAKIKRKLQFINKETRRDENKKRQHQSSASSDCVRPIYVGRYANKHRATRKLFIFHFFRKIKIINMPLNRLNATWTLMKARCKETRQLLSQLFLFYGAWALERDQDNLPRSLSSFKWLLVKRFSWSGHRQNDVALICVLIGRIKIKPTMIVRPSLLMLMHR